MNFTRLWTNAQALLESRIGSKDFVLVQLFSFPKGLKFILSADKDPYFFNYDRDGKSHAINGNGSNRKESQARSEQSKVM